MRKRSIKNTRVNTEVQHELSNIIRGGLKDPRVAPWTSVVAAEVGKLAVNSGEINKSIKQSLKELTATIKALEEIK